jgi:soluble lytic murein transglycosylase-like protein
MTPRPIRSRRLRGIGVIVAIATVGAAGTSAFPGTRYVVRAGDSLTSIASHLHVTVTALATANHLRDPNRIAAGSSLIVPNPRPAARPAPAPRDPITPGPLAPVVTPPLGPARYPDALLAHPSRLAFVPTFRYWARAYSVPPGLAEAVAWVESGWQTAAVSSTGAIGIGQIEPYTATFISRDLLHLATPLDPRVPQANIRMSAAYLGFLLWATKGNVANTVGSYYEGLSTLRNKGVYDSARRYVAAVGSWWAMFRSG